MAARVWMASRVDDGGGAGGGAGGYQVPGGSSAADNRATLWIAVL